MEGGVRAALLATASGGSKRIEADPLDPGMNSKSCKFVAQASENEPDVALALCFVDFFRDVSCESPTFETLFGRVASRNGLETYGFV